MKNRKKNYSQIAPKYFYSQSYQNDTIKREKNSSNPSKKIIYSFKTQRFNNSQGNNKYNNISQENLSLRKQIMALSSQNRNLLKRLNNDYHTFLNTDSNDHKTMHNIKKKPLYQTNLVQDYMTNDNSDNNKSIPKKDKKFLDESIDTVIKTHMKTNNSNENNEKMENLHRVKTNTMLLRNLRNNDSQFNIKKKK